jgi:hypothetical protein
VIRCASASIGRDEHSAAVRGRRVDAQIGRHFLSI